MKMGGDTPTTYISKGDQFRLVPALRVFGP